MIRMSSPAFGFISGISTAVGLLPHISVLCVLLVIGTPSRSITSLVVFTIGAKSLGEWFFWSYYKKRMDFEPKLKNWRSVVNKSLLSHPNVIIGLIMMFLDVLIDANLIHLALTMSINPFWVFLSLLGCQALAAPVQGVLSDVFSRKKSLLLANVMGLISLLACPMIFSGEKNIRIPMGTNMQIIIILCIKGLFANITVIARAIVAEIVKTKTIEKFSKV